MDEKERMYHKGFIMKKKLFCLGICAGIFALFTLSCNIGLGQAVDTQPPELNILHPEAGVIIRDSFIIGGTWSDDGSIKPQSGLIIELERTDEEGFSAVFEGSVGKDDWSCVVNPFDSDKPLNDGEYLATITITDTYEHSTVKTVNFTIDNTKPIIVLQRPSAKIGDSSPDTYGQTFSLTGQAADDNNIDSIDVNLYADESCETLLHTVRLENVPPTIELDVAKFAEGVDNDYSKIYGAKTKSGTKNFYCQIVAYDGAQRYPADGSEQTDADKRGNYTTHYYLYEEISSSILNDYKITEVYHMMNGNYRGGEPESRAATISSIKETLNSNQIVTGYFSLNPANNPSFTVSGRESLKKDGTDFVGTQDQYISNGASVVIEVAVGLDSIPLEADSLKVYAIECDTSGNEKSGAEKVYLGGTQSKVGTTYKFVVPLSSSAGLNLGDNYLFGVEGYDQKSNPVVSSGNGYGFHFTSAGSAPDLFVTSPAGSNVYKKAGDSVELTGYVDVDDGLPIISIIEGTNTLWTKNYTAADATLTSANRKEYVFSYTIPSSYFNQSQSKDYTFTVKATNDELSATVTKTIRYDVGKPLCEIIEFTPVVSNAAHENNINGIVKVRGTLSDEYTQMNFENHACRWEVYQDGAKVNGLGGDLASTFNFEINTTLLQDKKEATIKYIYQDSAGMSDVKEVTYFVDQDTDLPTLESVDESVWTKAVDNVDVLNTKLNAGDRTNTFSSKAQLSYLVSDDDGIARVTIAKNGGTAENQSVSGKPKSLTCFYEVPEDSEQYELEFKYYDIYFECENFEDTATLSAAEANPVNEKHYNHFTIWIQVAGAKPQITLNATPSCVTTNTDKISSEAKQKFTITGTIGGVGPYKISVNSNNDETHNIFYKKPNTNDYVTLTKVTDTNDNNYGKYVFPDEAISSGKVSWKDEFTPAAGTLSGTKTFTAYDKWNIDQSLNFDYQVDNARPTVSINAQYNDLNPDASNPGYPNATKTQDSQFTFRGTALDDNEQSLTKVEIQFTEHKEAPNTVPPSESMPFDNTKNQYGTADASGWITVDDLTSWNKAIYFNQYKVFDKESKKDIYLRVTDAAGNYNDNYETVCATFAYDKAKPVLSLDNKTSNLPDGTYTLSGKIVENFGFTTPTVTITEWKKDSSGAYNKTSGNGITNPMNVTLTETTDGSGVWTFSQEIPFDLDLDGDVKYTFEATDANGKTLDPNGVTEMLANRDITAPAITITAPSNKTYGEGSISGDSTQIKGTIDEPHRNKLYWAVVKSGNTAPTTLDKDKVLANTDTQIRAMGWNVEDVTDLTDSVSGDKYNWKFTASFDSIPATRDGKYTLYVQASDLGGNTSDLKTQEFVVDSAVPSLNVNVMGRATEDATQDTALTDTLTGSKTIKAIYGETYSLTGTVSDTNGIKSLKVSIDGAAPIDVTVANDGTWEVPAVKAQGAERATEGEHTYVFKAVDNTGRDVIPTITGDVAISGKETEVTTTVIYDLADPEVSINVLDDDGKWLYATGKTYISGTASDASGLKKITLQLDSNAEVTVPTSEEWQKDVDFTNALETTLGTTNTNVHKLTIKVTDKCEKTKTIERIFYLDKSLPDITKFDCADTKSASKYTSDVRNVKIKGFAYDGVQSAKRAVTLSLSAVDSSGEKKDIGSPAITPGTDSSNYGKFENVSISEKDLPEGDYTFTLTAKDDAGNVKEEKFTINVDKTPPTIGNVTMTWDDNLEPDTDGNIPIHNNPSATFSLAPTDENLSSVEYYVDDESTVISALENIEAGEWSNVPVKGSGYGRSYKFSDGEGKIYFKVTDKAGNVSYSNSTNSLIYKVDTTKPEYCEIDTIDGNTPTANSIKLINGKSALEFTVIAKDFDYKYEGTGAERAQKGLTTKKIRSVTLIKIGDTNVSIEGVATNATTTKDKWTITVPEDKFTGMTKGNKTLKVRVKDIAGTADTAKYKDFDVFTIDLDNDPPAPSISSPDTGDDVTVNGTHKISGTVIEDNPVSVALYYSNAATAPNALTGWTLFKKYTTETGTNTETVIYGKRTSEITNWSFDGFDFNTLSGAKDGTLKKHDIWLLAYAEDKAGNFSAITSPTQYHVDMDADRPVIKFNNIILGSNMNSGDARIGFENSEVYGSITDDDGVPTEVKYYIGTSAPAKDSSDWKSTDSDFSCANGSFTLKFPEDGKKNIYFKVTDKAGSVFISSESTTYDVGTVIISDGDNYYGTRPASGTTTKGSGVYILVDTKAPDVYGESYCLKTPSESAETDWSGSISAATFGGTSNILYLRQYAYDTNGIKSMIVHIPYETGDNNVTGYSNKTAGSTPSETGYYEYKFTEATGAGSTLTLQGIEYTKWISSAINVKGMKSGQRAAEIIVSDGTKKKTTLVNITIDNTPPVVTFDSPSANEQMRAGFLMKGQFTDGDEGTQLWYKLSTASTTPTSWSATPVKETTAINWRISFDGDTEPQDAYTHDSVPKEIIASLLDNVSIAESGENTGKAVITATNALYTTITTVYFHFKVQDHLGNESTTYIPLRLDPQGDIPVITRVTPDATETTLGGTIRFSGSAEDDNEIAALYIEVDPAYNEANGFVPWSDSHKTPNGKTLTEIINATNYPNNTYELINSKVESGKKKDTTIKAIYIGKGLSWNIALNKYAEWDNKSTGINNVAVRFYAVDVDGNMSQPTADDIFVFQVDSDKPKIGNSAVFYLKQYSNNNAGTGNVTASVEYTDGMWLKGEWWLEGSAEDESGIKTITMKAGESGTPTDISGSSSSVSKGNGANQWPNTSGYITHYKVGSATANRAGKLTYTLAVSDNDDKTNEKTFAINYDNKAPTLANTNDENYSISSTVKNSNGYYSIRSAVVEGDGESGFDKVVFYFKRTTTGYQNVYDSYMAKSYKNASNQDVKTSNQFAYANLTYDSYLYWKSATLSSVSGNTVTITAKDENIHVGGLMKVAGTIYTIKGIDQAGTTITLSGNPSETATGTILFAIGHVVDHNGAESNGTNAGKITTVNATNKGYGYGYYSNSPDDDGDMMIETVSTSGTRTIWSAAINSNNIPDGPIELHYVAFDKAGNVAHGVVEGASVANNAPRLAGVTIWSDYNGNSIGWRNNGEHAADYESETKSKYYVRVRPQINGKATDRSNDVTSKLIVSSNDYGIEDPTDGNAYMKVTDTVKFIPELVGGNGALFYEYKIGKKSAFTVSNGKITGFTASETALKGGAKNSQLALKDDSGAQVSGKDEGDEYSKVTDPNTTLTYVDGNTAGVITFDAATYLAPIGNSSTDEPTWFDIIIWDSTEGGTPYENTLNCEMQIALNNQYNDDVLPKAYIRPFHWANESENSVYWDKKQVTDTEKVPFGHIELEEDLPLTFTTGGSGVYDRDPKVSGKIKIDGYAFDNIRLKEIKVAFNDDATGATAATYSGGAWTGNSVTGWSMAVENVFATSDGHLAHWTLTVDTEALVSTKAAVNQVIKVLAVDARGSNGGNKSSFGSKQTGKYVTDAEWGKISAADKATNTYYMDASCTTEVITSAVTDTTVVYLPVSYTWSAVKNESGATSTYFTDPTFITPVTSATPNDAKVYKNPMTAYYKMDVVPYITEVKRNSTYNTNRARSGATPLLRGETTNTISGFNLASSQTKALKVTPNKDGSGTAVEMTDVTVSGNGLTFTVPTSAKSGYLQLTVNGVPALNNINAYKPYNEETNAKAYDHNTLTDDRYVQVWRVTSNDTFKGSLNAVYPAMSKNPTNNTLYASFTNYGEAKTYYTNQFTGTSAVGVSSYIGCDNYNSFMTSATPNATIQASSGVATVFNGYDPPEITDISVGPDGRVNVFYAANYHGGTPDNWKGTDSTDAGGIYIYDESASSVDCSRSVHNIWRTELFTYDNELNQFKNIRVNRTTDASGNTYSNVVYYDRLTNAIKYSYAASTYSFSSTGYSRTFTYNNTLGGFTVNTAITGNKTYYVSIAGDYKEMKKHTGTGNRTYYTFEGYNNTEGFTSTLYTRGNSRSSPDTESNGLPWVTIDGSYDTVDNGGSDFNFAGGWEPFILTNARFDNGISSRTSGTGESVALTANPNGYAVILYMDATTGQLRIARASSRTPNALANWKVQGVFASSDENYDTASDYMAAAVDSDGYLHIAFQNTKGQLVYAKSTNAPTDGTTAYTFGSSQVLDDSGMWIDLTLDGTTPYISYLSRINSTDGMKLAYYDSTFDANNDGVADGGWETMTAPLDQKVTNVRTCIEVNAKAQDDNVYKAAVGFCPGADYRAAFFVGK